MPRCVRSSPVPPGPVQSGLSLLRALVTGHVLYEQGVCDGLESKPHGCKRLPFSPRVYRGLEGWRGMARVSNRGMARVNRGMARQINLKNKDKGIQKTKKHKKISSEKSAVKKFRKKRSSVKKCSKEVQ